MSKIGEQADIFTAERLGMQESVDSAAPPGNSRSRELLACEVENKRTLGMIPVVRLKPLEQAMFGLVIKSDCNQAFHKVDDIELFPLLRTGSVQQRARFGAMFSVRKPCRIKKRKTFGPVTRVSVPHRQLAREARFAILAQFEVDLGRVIADRAVINEGERIAVRATC